jgi:hypothetical protein
MVVALVAMTLLGCGRPEPELPRQPVPTFDSEPANGGARAAHHDTLLPTDCQNMTTGATMSALLGKPLDSVQSHTVLGVAAASVGRLERVTCQYQLAGRKPVRPVLELNLAAYTTPSAADRQMTTNAVAERVDAQQVENFSIGSARAMLFGERGQFVLLVSNGRCSITLTLHDGVVPAEQAKPVMVDLVQRVLPNLASVGTGTSR